MARHRKNASADITEEVLQDIDSKIKDYHEVFKATIAKSLPSKGHTIKYHRLSHVTDVIRRLGHLKEYDAQFYEAANRHEKALYKRTPGRQVKEQHLEGMVIRLRTQAMASARNTYDPDATVRNKRSAYIVAAETGEHAMVAVRIPLHTNGLTPNTLPAAMNWLETMPDWIQLRFQLASYYGISDPDDPDMPCIQVGTTTVLAAEVPWEDKDTGELQTVRATPAFHGKPYFDSVEIRLRDGAMNARNVAYAQLRLLFSAVNPRTGGNENLVFLRMYSRTRPDDDDLLSQYGCVPLSWARLTNTVKGTGAYRVCLLENIIRRVYIVPDFSKDGQCRFHTCAFKWARHPVENYLG
jgi:hypothetical protein